MLRWRFGSLERVGKILDFASGYGRVTRFLVRDVPPELVWVADVYADGVRFQEELAAAEKFVRRNPLFGNPHKFGTRKLAVENISLYSGLC